MVCLAAAPAITKVMSSPDGQIPGRVLPSSQPPLSPLMTRILNLDFAASTDGLGVGAFFDQICQSGSHQSSIMMVSDKRADCAAIDAVTWRYATQSHPDIVAGIKVIGSTEPVAGLPLITNHAELTVPILCCVRDQGGFDAGCVSL